MARRVQIARPKPMGDGSQNQKQTMTTPEEPSFDDTRDARRAAIDEASAHHAIDVLVDARFAATVRIATLVANVRSLTRDLTAARKRIAAMEKSATATSTTAKTET